MKLYLFNLLLVFTNFVSAQVVDEKNDCEKVFRETELKTMNGFLKNFISSSKYLCHKDEIFLTSFKNNKLALQIIWGDSNEQIINVYFLLDKCDQIFDEIPRNKDLIVKYTNQINLAKSYLKNAENRLNIDASIIVCFNFLYNKEKDIITKPDKSENPINIYDLRSYNVYHLDTDDKINNNSKIKIIDINRNETIANEFSIIDKFLRD